jgi:peptidoglycan/LPS O-acetylase OafA/YrhL
VLTFCALWLIAAVITAKIYDTLLLETIQPTYAPYFIAGILMFLIYRTGSTPLLWGLVGLCYLICVYQVSSETHGMNSLLHTSMEWRWSAVLITIFYAAIAAVALGWLSWAKWRWLTFAGALTYPLYLLHQDIGLIIIRSLRDDVPKWPLLIGTILTMLVAAYLGHRLIEKPIAPRLKRLLTASMDMNPPDRLKRAAAISQPADPGADGQRVNGGGEDRGTAGDHGSWPGLRQPGGQDPQPSASRSASPSPSSEERRHPDTDPLLARRA